MPIDQPPAIVQPGKVFSVHQGNGGWWAHIEGHAYPLGSWRSRSDLPFAGIPKPIGGSPERPSKPSNSDGCHGSYSGSRCIKGFSDLNEDEWKQAVRGATFVIGLCAFFAYLAVERDEKRQARDNHRRGE